MTLELRQVRMPVDDRRASWKRCDEPRLPPRARPAVVDDPDPETADVDDVPARKKPPQLRVVHVPVHPLDGAELPQLVEEGARGEVAAVDDQVRRLQPSEALVRKAPRPARKVRVGDDRDDQGGVTRC